MKKYIKYLIIPAIIIIAILLWSHFRKAKLAPEWRLGLAINPTFADETEYEKNFVGRHSGLKTKIRIINVNPSVAYKVNDALSLAFGINFAKANVEFQQAVPNALGPTRPDGMGTLQGDATGWGYNLGLMYQVT